MDTITLRGQTDYEADYTRQGAQQTPYPDRFLDGVLIAEQATVLVQEQYKLKGDKGFITRERLDALRDLFLSKEVFSIENGTLTPVSVVTKNLKLYTNKTRLYAALVEYQPAFDNEFYTAAALGIAVASCPAVDSLSVRQISSTKLEIFWALRSSYHQVQIEVMLNGQTTQLIGNGNTGRITQNIVLTGTTLVPITVRGRTICNAYSTPMGVGQWTTSLYNSQPNLPPVAVYDALSMPFVLNIPYTIPTSVLTNDYDPEGDLIEVVLYSGYTVFYRSHYSIDAAGFITITPKATSVNDVDGLGYSILETTTGRTANASVTLSYQGAGSGNIFVRVAERNGTTITSGNVTGRTGERWLDFFSDPAGTVVLDVTGRNLVINYDEKCTTVHLSQPTLYTHNLTANGTGAKVKIYTGTLDAILPYVFGGVATTTYSHRVLAGNGYKGI